MTSFTPPARPTGVLDVCLFLLTYAVQDGAVWHRGQVCDLTLMTPQESLAGLSILCLQDMLLQLEDSSRLTEDLL